MKGPSDIPVLHDNCCSEDDSDGDTLESGHEIHNNVVALVRRAIMKSIDKEEQFLNSGRVLTVMDAKRGNHYVIL